MDGVEKTKEGEEVDCVDGTWHRSRLHEECMNGFTHLPLRNWRRHCVRGRAERSIASARRGRKADCHIFMWITCSWGEEHEGKTLAILVAREKYTKSTFATVVPRKGTDQWVPRRLLAWMREIGLEHNEVAAHPD